MGTLGTAALYGAVLSLLSTLGAGVLAGRTGSPALARWTRAGVIANALFVTSAVLVLQVALVRLDFSLKYVGEYTASTLSVPYRIGSMWAGQAGSLLLWSWIIAIGGLVALVASQRRGLDLSPWVWVIIAVADSLFIGLVAFLQSPFIPQSQRLADGAGLNPLLQNPLQLIHPVLLYGGYVLFTIPFAIVVGSLIGGSATGRWIEYARFWAVVPWVSLSIGMLLGARWAYEELGWGGYWAWDPVENASLIPWLAATALLHTGLAQHGNRARLRTSSVLLLTATFNLCLFGTFLTRSGVVASVHAFGTSNVGPVIGTAIFLSVFGTGAVLVWRLPLLQYLDPKRRASGWLGHRLLIGLLVLMTVAVFWGTVYPLFARAFLHQEVAVTAGFFDAVVTPMALCLLVLLAVSPFLPGQRVPDVRREAVIRIALFVIVGGSLLAIQARVVVAFVLALAVLDLRTILWRSAPKLGAALRQQRGRPRAFAQPSSSFLAHIGLVILFAAITINVTGEVKQQVRLAVGATGTAAGQQLRLDSARVMNYPDRQSLEGVVTLFDGPGNGTEVEIGVSAFRNSSEPFTKVGIHSTPLHDVYVVIDNWPTNFAQGIGWLRLTVYDNPAITWIWFGGGLIGFAGVLFLIPARRRPRVQEGAVLAAAAVEEPATGGSRRALVAVGLVVVVAAGAFAVGHVTGSQPSNSVPMSTATDVDMAKVTTLMEKLTANPKDATTYAELGALYFNAGTEAATSGEERKAIGHFSKAVTFFTKRSALTPTDLNAWLDLGASALASRQRELSYSALGKAIAIDPKNQLAHFDLAIWYLNAQPSDVAKADAEFREVIAIDPKTSLGMTASRRLTASATPNASASAVAK